MKIEKMPILGFVFRWIYSLARLNNTRYGFYHLTSNVNELNREIYELKCATEEYKKEIYELKCAIKKQNEQIPVAISKELYYQSLALQQRVDQFIFDSNIELKTKIFDDKDKCEQN